MAKYFSNLTASSCNTEDTEVPQHRRSSHNVVTVPKGNDLTIYEDNENFIWSKLIFKGLGKVKNESNQSLRVTEIEVNGKPINTSEFADILEAVCMANYLKVTGNSYDGEEEPYTREYPVDYCEPM